MSGTGENEMGLRKIVDITRFGSVLLLLLHFYYYCYQAFASWELTSLLSDRLLRQVATTGLFDSFLQSKTGALLLLVISLIGTRGRTELEISKPKIVTLTALGLLLFFWRLLLASTKGPLPVDKRCLHDHYNQRVFINSYRRHPAYTHYTIIPRYRCVQR